MTSPTEVLSAMAAPRDAARTGTGILALFSATLFLSAFLLFLLEPMIAKMVLPVLGGTPMVWNTCVLFFQITLLSGYAYAHGASSWLAPKRHALVYSAILVLPILVLPFALRGAENPPADTNPIPWLLGVLLRSIGLPFFALSTSASLLQKLFSNTGHRAARDPYFLYAASNTGSLLALLAYPSLVEPSLALGAQARVWALGYFAFAAMAMGCLAIGRRQSEGGREQSSIVVRRPSDVVSQPTAVVGRQSAVVSQQSAVGSQQSAVGSQQSAVSGQSSNVVGRPSAVNSRPSSVNSRRSSVSRRTSSANRQTTSSDNHRRSSSVVRRTSSANRQPSSVDSRPSSVNSRRSAVNSRRSAVNSRRSAVNRRTSSVGRRTSSANR